MWGSRRGIEALERAVEAFIKLAQDALATVAETKAMIESHKESCTEKDNERVRRETAMDKRHAEDTAKLEGSIQVVHNRVTSIRSSIWALILAVLGGTVVIIGYLVTHPNPWIEKEAIIEKPPPINLQIIIPPETAKAAIDKLKDK